MALYKTIAYLPKRWASFCLLAVSSLPFSLSKFYRFMRITGGYDVENAIEAAACSMQVPWLQTCTNALQTSFDVFQGEPTRTSNSTGLCIKKALRHDGMHPLQQCA